MKKVIMAVAVIATVACFSSCNKTCTCKTYAAGVVLSTEEGVELDKDTYKKCSDMSILVIADPKSGLECE